MLTFDTRDALERLRGAGGGYEIVHQSPGLELSVYALLAPEPDRQGAIALVSRGWRPGHARRLRSSPHPGKTVPLHPPREIERGDDRRGWGPSGPGSPGCCLTCDDRTQLS